MCGTSPSFTLPTFILKYFPLLFVFQKKNGYLCNDFKGFAFFTAKQHLETRRRVYPVRQRTESALQTEVHDRLHDVFPCAFISIQICMYKYTAITSDGKLFCY